MVENKIKGILFLGLILIIIFLGFTSACHCGDGIINQASEECDYGELNGFLCWAGYGTSCEYCTIDCKLKTITNYCGDGILNSACEECDDGNTQSGDGCSASCVDEFCGDDVINNVNEQCDNNGQNGIACSPDYGDSCEYCSENCDIITLYGGYCGDGILNSACEECDDGNNLDGDGCSASCEIEELCIYCGDGICNDNENCSTCPEDCGICPPTPYCGDGNLDEGEQCDLGTLNGILCDNSSSSCAYCNLNCEKIILSYEEEDDEDDDDKNSKEIEFKEQCIPNWKCTGWSDCENGITTRVCTDSNSCSYSYGKPIEANYCENTQILEPTEKNGFSLKSLSSSMLWFLIFLFLIALLILLILILSPKK